MKLWRPVGPKELRLIEETGMRAFPPRLPEQPFFYPVLSFGYAEKIARDWNATRPDEGLEGFVTSFEIDDAYAAGFEVQNAGGRAHQELWVPAEELTAFNGHILGAIEVVAAYRNGVRVCEDAAKG